MARAHDGIAALALGGALVYVALQGKSEQLWELVKEDGPGYLKWGIATIVLLYIVRKLPGVSGSIGEALILAAGVAFALVNVPNVAKEIELIFK